MKLVEVSPVRAISQVPSPFTKVQDRGLGGCDRRTFLLGALREVRWIGISNWPAYGEPDMIEIDTDGSPTVGGWFHVQNGARQARARLGSALPPASSTG